MVNGAGQGDLYLLDSVGSNPKGSPFCSELDFQDSNPDFFTSSHFLFSNQFRTTLYDTCSQRLT